MPLLVDAGHATHCGTRARNEDFVGMVTPDEPELSSKGLLAAVADGPPGAAPSRTAGRTLVMKTLTPERAADPEERAAFAYEEWLARRAVARFFPQVIDPARRNHLYYLSTWHEGHTLQQRLDVGHHFTVPEVLALGGQLVRACGALHRRSIIHRDIKPANLHLGADGQVRLLDLGVAQSGMTVDEDGLNGGGVAGGGGGARAPAAARAGGAGPHGLQDGVDGRGGQGSLGSHMAQPAGTPSFLAPEQLDNAPACAQTDLYAAGVTLYFALTRHYPYGEIEPFQRPRFGQPVPPSRYRPDLPLWLEHVLLKAVAKAPLDRFETAEEFLLAIERGASRPLAPPPPVPLAGRQPVAVLGAVALISVVLNVLLLYLLVLRR